MATVPDVTGLTLSAAQSAWTSAGFTGSLTSNGTYNTSSSTYASLNNTVYSQSRVAGTSATSTSSMTVILVNYTAPTTGTVPNVTGQTLSAAQSSFSSAGFTGGLTSSGTTSSGATSGNNGTVASQSLTAGSTANLTSAMTVVLYSYTAPPPTYSVTYAGNGNTGGSAPTDSNTYASGATVTAQGVGSLTKTGYSFGGWTISSGGTVSGGGTFTMPASNVTLSAIWNINKYTVTWNDGGHGTLSFYSSTNVSYGSSVTSPLVSEYTNYSFLQFNGTNGNIVGQNSPTVGITADTTYTAQYQYSPPPSYPPAWSDNSLSSTVVAGTAYSDGVTATNMNYSGSYSVSLGALPDGLSLNTSTGAVTGTPTVVGPFSFTITATNSYGSVSQAFSVTVNGGWYTYKSGAWVASTAQKYGGSQWVTGTVYKYDGSVWLVSGY